MAVDFEPPQEFVDFYRLLVRPVAAVDPVDLVGQIQARPFAGGDGRELEKTVSGASFTRSIRGSSDGAVSCS